jgi:hypothetical protein
MDDRDVLLFSRQRHLISGLSDSEIYVAIQFEAIDDSSLPEDKNEGITFSRSRVSICQVVALKYFAAS